MPGQVAMVRWIIAKPYFQELHVHDPADFFARQMTYLETIIFLHYRGTGPAGQYINIVHGQYMDIVHGFG
jgi:hypothetical protein